MSIKIESLTLDASPCCSATPPSICGRQGDEGTVLNVTVTQNGQAMSLDGLTATLLGNNPNLLQLVGTVSGSTATFTLPSAFFSAACIVRLYVQLAQGDDVVASTQTFTLKVAPGADLSASQAQGYVTQLDEALATAQQASQTAEAAAAQATQAVDDANTALETANTAVQNANTAADAANAAATNANNAAQTVRTNILTGTVGPATIASADDAHPGALMREVQVLGQTRQNLWINPGGTRNGITSTSNSDGSISFSGAVNSLGAYITTSNQYSLQPETNYTFSVDKTPDFQGFFVNFYDESGEQIGSSNYFTGTKTVKTPSNLSYSVFGVGFNSNQEGVQVSGTYRIMLNEGSTAEPWCPPGLTSVSELETVVAGKNLCDGVATAGSLTSLNATFGHTKLSKGLQYTISINVEGATSFSANVRIIAQDGHYETVGYLSQSQNSSTFSAPESGVLNLNGYGIVGTIESVELMLELGSEATAYEPPSVTTTPQDLEGHELRSLPDGTRDVLTWGADGTRSIEQNVDEYKASGNESVYFNNDVGEFSFALQDISRISWDAFLCDVLPVVESTGSVDVGTSIGGTSVYFKVPGVDDADKAKQWLAANTPTLIYPCTQQTVTLAPVPMTEQPSTTLNVWADADEWLSPEVEVTYERDLTLAYNDLASKVAALEVTQATN